MYFLKKGKANPFAILTDTIAGQQKQPKNKKNKKRKIPPCAQRLNSRHKISFIFLPNT